jgi:hypothetical protein
MQGAQAAGHGPRRRQVPWLLVLHRRSDQPTKTTFALMLEPGRLDFGVEETRSGPFVASPIGR